MKFIEALNSVIKQPSNEASVNYSTLCSSCGTMEYDLDWQTFETRIKAYWLENWLCTDTIVGISAIFFDDELVAWSEQEARKSDYDLTFISDESFQKVKYWVLQNTISPNNYSVATQKDFDREIPEYTNVYYGSQLLVKEGFYQNEPVQVLIKNFYDYDINKLTKITIQITSTGERKEIEANEFFYLLNINKQD